MFDFLKSGSAKIEAEIADESKRAEAAAAAEAQLKSARADALLAGDGKELDRIDAALATSSRDASRRAERVELLQSKLQEAQEREEGERLDAIAARADKARRMGEELLRKDYAKQAAALAETLTKLRAIDHFINEQNRVLDSNGRNTIARSNDVRHILPRSEKIRRRKRVGIAEALHPNHREWRESNYQEPSAHGPPSEFISLPSSKNVPRFTEVEYDDVINHAPTWATPVYEVIQHIPQPTSDHVPLYHYEQRASFDELQKIAEELSV